MLTTTPNDSVVPHHYRMPFILRAEQYADWLGDNWQRVLENPDKGPLEKIRKQPELFWTRISRINTDFSFPNFRVSAFALAHRQLLARAAGRAEQKHRMRLTEHIWNRVPSHCLVASQPDSR